MTKEDTKNTPIPAESTPETMTQEEQQNTNASMESELSANTVEQESPVSSAENTAPHNLAQNEITKDNPEQVQNSEQEQHPDQGITAPINFASPTSELDAPQSPTEQTVEEQAPAQPQEKVLPTMGFAAKAFAHMSKLAPIYLILLFALHMFASTWLPSVYFPVELAHMEIYNQMQASGQWLIPPVSEALGATLPGYYWFMALVDMLPIPDSIYFPVLSAVAAFIALCGIYTLGLCTEVGKSATFASGLLLLSCPLFLIFMHMMGPEMLTAGFFSLSSALLFRGWTKDNAPFSFIFGFLFLALATFTGGFLPLWTTIIASLLLILWRGSLHRAHQLDAVIGFGVLVLSFALWLVLSILGSEHATALDSIMLQAITPFMPPYWPLPLPWALLFLAVGLLPWILLPLFASWFSILGKSFSHLKASRTDNSGPTWLYLLALIGIALILFQKKDALFTVIPLVPILGIILAKTACNLSRLGSNIYFLLLALCLLIGGICITIMSIPSAAPYWTPYLSEDMARILSNLKGLPLLSAVFILTALLLVRFTKRAFPEGALMVMALFSVLMVQPMTFFVAPSLVGHVAQVHPLGEGLGTLPLSIAPHMPVHPVGHFPVSPIGPDEDPNPAPTPVVTAPEPTKESSEPAPMPTNEPTDSNAPSEAPVDAQIQPEVPTPAVPEQEPAVAPVIAPEQSLPEAQPDAPAAPAPQVEPQPEPTSQQTEPSTAL